MFNVSDDDKERAFVFDVMASKFMKKITHLGRVSSVKILENLYSANGVLFQFTFESVRDLLIINNDI